MLTSESLFFRCWFLDVSLMNIWEKHWRYSDVFNANVNDHNCFYWHDLPKHWCFIAARRWSLMILWWTVEVKAKISLQALMIYKGFIDLISEPLMFHCCFVDDSLMTLWRDIIETMTILMETFLIFIVFVVLNSESLMFHCFFILDSLMTHWRRIDDSSI